MQRFQRIVEICCCTEGGGCKGRVSSWQLGIGISWKGYFRQRDVKIDSTGRSWEVESHVLFGQEISAQVLEEKWMGRRFFLDCCDCPDIQFHEHIACIRETLAKCFAH